MHVAHHLRQDLARVDLVHRNLRALGLQAPSELRGEVQVRQLRLAVRTEELVGLLHVQLLRLFVAGDHLKLPEVEAVVQVAHVGADDHDARLLAKALRGQQARQELLHQQEVPEVVRRHGHLQAVLRQAAVRQHDARIQDQGLRLDPCLLQQPCEPPDRLEGGGVKRHEDQLLLLHLARALLHDLLHGCERLVLAAASEDHRRACISQGFRGLVPDARVAARDDEGLALQAALAQVRVCWTSHHETVARDDDGDVDGPSDALHAPVGPKTNMLQARGSKQRCHRRGQEQQNVAWHRGPLYEGVLEAEDAEDIAARDACHGIEDTPLRRVDRGRESRRDCE
mmetsp:Transcript_79126/g.256541  ORF Transcript_79126/g.256541 Transcript_79126/m.256541 type:complete len:340 (+) Transcript_79126:783-1802(+)